MVDQRIGTQGLSSQALTPSLTTSFSLHFSLHSFFTFDPATLSKFPALFSTLLALSLHLLCSSLLLCSPSSPPSDIHPPDAAFAAELGRLDGVLGPALVAGLGFHSAVVHRVTGVGVIPERSRERRLE